MRMLVTGAAGFIGSHLSERLIGDGHSVIGVDSFTDYYSGDRKRANIAGLAGAENFRLLEADLRELDWSPLLGEVDVVFHLAGQPGVRRSWGSEFQIYLDENILATQMLLEAAKGSDLTRLVIASSSSVYGDAETMPTPESVAPAPVSPYGVSKLAVEHLSRLYSTRFGVPSVALRYFTVFGPRQRPDMAFQRFIEAGLDDRPIEIFGDGHQSRDFTYVADIVDATIRAGSEGHREQIYNVAGGTQSTVREVVTMLAEQFGKEIVVRYGPAVAGDARHTAGDTDRARAQLGFHPKIGLEEGLARQIEATRAMRLQLR